MARDAERKVSTIVRRGEWGGERTFAAERSAARRSGPLRRGRSRAPESSGGTSRSA